MLTPEASLDSEKDSILPRGSKADVASDLEEEASELPPEVAAKQLSEDDALAKKLEESISKKLSDRNIERN